MAHNGFHPALSPAISPSTSETFSHNLLTSSISSLSASTTASRHPSQISKTYRQSSTLFLTRRLPEALTTLLPLITPPESSAHSEPAPIAVASRTTRIKVWSLYLTILNAIIELEPDEGKDAFGAQEWRGLCNKVRDGAIWEEVVKNGYHGVEGDVDSDVVINLATLLLAHARDQTLNQKRLEAFLASAQAPSLDLSGRLSESRSPGPRVGRLRAASKGRSGANTPRDLNARVKILELYTLHVLLRNNEWDYAREFITVSSVLDEERREAFLQALQSLQEEQLAQDRREEEERQRQEEQLRKDIEIARRLRAENEERERKRVEEERARREGSEIDYGVEDAPSTAGSSTMGRHTRNQSNASSDPRPANQKARGKQVAQRPQTITARASMMMVRLRAIINQLGETLNNNPTAVMRLLAFIMGFLLVLGHKGIRQRVQRVLGGSWNKVKATAGMGTKVSYI